MKAGKLRHRITIQRQHQFIPDKSTGHRQIHWQDLASVWARIEPLSVREFVQSAALQSKITVRITLRPTDVQASDRIVYGDKIYNIEGVLGDNKSGLEYLTLPCSEGVNDG